MTNLDVPSAMRRLFHSQRRVLLVVLFVAIAGSVAAALLWPTYPCSDPICAHRRFAVAVEIDAFQGAAAPPLTADTADGLQSAQKVLATGGIDAKFTLDQTDIPYDVSQGRLDRADLYQFFQAWRSTEPTGRSDARIHALITATGIVADNGTPLFGLMFDYEGREGFAVAPSETVAAFSKVEPESIGALQMRTFLHELLHALNRGHLDAAQFPGARLTLEAPTKCISNAVKHEWSLQEAPLFALSPATIRFFQTSPREAVLPGILNTSFDLQRNSATECEHARENAVSEPITTRWAWFRKRFSPHWLSSARAEEQPDAEVKTPEMSLRIQAQPAAYPLGYPVSVRLIAANNGDAAVPLKGRLAPAYGMLQIETRTQGESEWRPVIPLARYEAASDEDAMLAPGESTEQTVPIYFGGSGWTFPAPEDYEIRARLVLGDSTEQVTSGIVQITVEGPRTSDDAAALEGLLDARNHLDRDVGRVLSFGGRGGPTDELDTIKRLVEKYPRTAIADALNLTLASQHLRPALDPRTGVRPKPDVQTAAQLLADACTDSGVSALKQQLMTQFLQTGLSDERNLSPQNETDAWEGTTRAADSRMATYSNPQLEPIGASIHFCRDEDRLRGPALREARRISRELRKNRTAHIIVTGHADYPASCSYNDALAMRRAEALKRVMMAHGISAQRVTAVSLGKRRPLDFATTPEADSLNRRVEVLVARSSASTVDETSAANAPTRAFPVCSLTP